MTVNEAFRFAQAQMEDENMQLEYVYLLDTERQSEIKISDLGITPVLISEESVRHNNKLYDSK